MRRGPIRIPPEERFWEHVDRRGPDECWPWIGAKAAALGYGNFSLGAGSAPNGKARYVMAHRYAWSLHTGRVLPVGRRMDFQILHTCDNPPCVNPAHLREGTFDVNMADREAKGRTAAREDHSQAKLTWTEARAIRASALPAKVLAAQYRVSVSNVRAIQSGKLWKEVAA